MKAAHKISERQTKGTLSAQKKKTKAAKVVLTKNDSEFWPAIVDNKRDKLIEIIQGISTSKQGINIGLQSTLRLVNNGTANFLIIGNEFSPKFCAKHLISSALHKNPNTKVLIVDRLKELTKTSLKVPSIIFSISKSIESPELNDFYEQMNVHDEWLRNYRRIHPQINVVVAKKKPKKVEISPSVTIIKKSRVINRVDEIVKETTNPFEDTSEFISFSNTSTSIYKPIKVRRVVGDPNRKKRKIAE